MHALALTAVSQTAAFISTEGEPRPGLVNTQMSPRPSSPPTLLRNIQQVHGSSAGVGGGGVYRMWQVQRIAVASGECTPVKGIQTSIFRGWKKKKRGADLLVLC